jgi:hypothetical protein
VTTEGSFFESGIQWTSPVHKVKKLQHLPGIFLPHLIFVDRWHCHAKYLAFNTFLL